MEFKLDLKDNTRKNSIFFQLADGESAVGVFQGESRALYIRWDDGVASETNENDPLGKFRFRINFVLRETMTPKIFDQSRVVYRQLAELNTEYNLSETWVRITRRGEGRDTTYRILPVKDWQLTPEERTQLSTLKHLSLTTTKGE